MTNTLIYIWSVVVMLGVSSVSALIWSVATGQLSQFQQGATSIFDDDEPIGEFTDSFPKKCKRTERQLNPKNKSVQENKSQ